MSNLFFSGPEKLAALFKVPDHRQLLVFEQYYKLCLVVEKYFFNRQNINFLEVGSGYSTGLFELFSQSLLSKNISLNITSMDFNFEIFENLKIKKSGMLNCLKGSTVSGKELVEFYRVGGLQSLINGKKILELVEDNFFSKPHIDSRKLEYWLSEQKLSSLGEFTKELSLNSWLYEKIIDYYSYSGSLDSDVKLLENELGTCQELQSHNFDVIFFDGGELKNNIEFNNLLPLIPIGGIAALHDIWFPKSFKSWLCAFYLMQSKEWECLYVDNSTPQGMAIFKRLI